MSFVLEHMRDNLWRGKFSSFTEDLCVHGLTGRLGGVSKKPYDSLNMALHVGDDPQAVWQNRQRFLHALGLKPENMVTPEQVHGDAVMRVGAAEAGRGARDYADAIAATDYISSPTLPKVHISLLLSYIYPNPLTVLTVLHQTVQGLQHNVPLCATDGVLLLQKDLNLSEGFARCKG